MTIRPLGSSLGSPGSLTVLVGVLTSSLFVVSDFRCRTWRLGLGVDRRLYPRWRSDRRRRRSMTESRGRFRRNPYRLTVLFAVDWCESDVPFDPFVCRPLKTKVLPLHEDGGWCTEDSLPKEMWSFFLCLRSVVLTCSCPFFKSSVSKSLLPT